MAKAKIQIERGNWDCYFKNWWPKYNFDATIDDQFNPVKQIRALLNKDLDKNESKCNRSLYRIDRVFTEADGSLTFWVRFSCGYHEKHPHEQYHVKMA
jgi:hypothetical protein